MDNPKQPEVVEAEIVGESPPPRENPTAGAFEEDVENTKLPPIVEEKPVSEETPVEPEASQTNQLQADPNFMTIRSDETGDKVYLLREKKRYWIKNPESLAKLGFYLGKEQKIPFSELLGYPEGEPIDLTVPGAVFPWDKPEGEKVSQPSDSSNIWQ